MSCPYYWYNYHYACRKSGKDVNEDIYDKYCKNYDYESCPIYRQEDSGGGCFLTSACVEARGLPDDCRELTILRTFRDTYLKNYPGGKEMVCDYYHCAPVIVEQIRHQPDCTDIFSRIYEELVLPCVKMIDAGKNEQALALYRDYTLRLKTMYT